MGHAKKELEQHVGRERTDFISQLELEQRLREDLLNLPGELRRDGYKVTVRVWQRGTPKSGMPILPRTHRYFHIGKNYIGFEVR